MPAYSASSATPASSPSPSDGYSLQGAMATLALDIDSGRPTRQWDDEFQSLSFALQVERPGHQNRTTGGLRPRLSTAPTGHPVGQNFELLTYVLHVLTVSYNDRYSELLC